jgi:hypothetical protein
MPLTAQGLDDSGDDHEVGECPECDAEVYLIAARCPKCGYWFTDDDRPSMRENIPFEMKFVKAAGAVLLVVLVVALLVVAAISAAG